MNVCRELKREDYQNCSVLYMSISLNIFVVKQKAEQSEKARIRPWTVKSTTVNSFLLVNKILCGRVIFRPLMPV